MLVGITGGIASGKSTVTDFFKKLGVPVISTDDISHELTARDKPTIDEIINVFGSEIHDSGKINKQKLKELIFADFKLKQRLENILHPRIKQRMLQILAGLNVPYAIVEVPLLIEAGWDKYVDRVLLVMVSRSEQIRRLRKRDDMNPDLAQRIIASQLSDEQRKKFADDIIITDQSINKLEQKVLNLHKKYLQMLE